MGGLVPIMTLTSLSFASLHSTICVMASTAAGAPNDYSTLVTRRNGPATQRRQP
jgi:hypothetical protein